MYNICYKLILLSKNLGPVLRYLKIKSSIMLCYSLYKFKQLIKYNIKFKVVYA